MKDERALIESGKNEALQRLRADRESALGDGDYQFEELLELIESRLFHPDFDLGELRRELTPSAEALRRFRLRCGGSPKAYVNARRLDAARRLLDEPGIEEPDVARALGFADALYFSRWFKRWTGETPKARRCVLRGRALPRRPSEPSEPPADWLTSFVWLRARARVLRCREISRLIYLIRATSLRPRRK